MRNREIDSCCGEGRRGSFPEPVVHNRDFFDRPDKRSNEIIILLVLGSSDVIAKELLSKPCFSDKRICSCLLQITVLIIPTLLIIPTAF